MKILSFGVSNFLICTLLLLQISCINKEKQEFKQEKTTNQSNPTKRVSVIKIDSPKSGEMFTVGDEIEIKIALKESDIKIDSLTIEAEGVKRVLKTENQSFNWKTEDLKTGSNQLKVFAYADGNRIDSYYLKLRFKSDIVPELYTCNLVKTYTHDKNAFTQGLVYEDGIMYEGTGQRGESVLRKTEFETGKLISELSLPAQYFGEGITIFKDKIIQLTWTSQTGFVYDKKSFKLLTKLEYPTQGWGITTDNKSLIMSDGSHIIHFLDPEYFNETRKVEVYDDKGMVESLNELEFINGLVYANVYQTKEIIAFDPKTGKVVKRIDCSSIVPKGYENQREYVLNGIAYDKKNDRYFITGKRWPKIYEVKFVRK